MNEITIDVLLDYTINGRRGGSVSELIETGFEIKPKEYLDFAKYDLETNYPHHLINCLSNTKRAIHCQVDSLLIYLGLYDTITHDDKYRKYKSFPAKIEILKNIGIISPQILNKINKQRNVLEHVYEYPNTDVDIYLDVAELFIEATNKYLVQGITSCEVSSNGTCNFFEAELDYKNNRLLIKFHDNESENRRIIEKEIIANMDTYLEYIKWFIGAYKF
ncbi:MAG: hypothetical protein RBQ97_06480 [Acholeplasma sp.]|nr:hypothetical protein [Acholeplasma sp.]